jgi:CAAX protease family protein
VNSPPRPTRPDGPPTTFAPPSSAQAGWYPDPYGHAWARYFDGHRWTDHVSVTPVGPAARDEHPVLPLFPVLGAVVVLAGSLIANRALIDATLDERWNVFVYMAISVVVGYGPSVVWFLFVSRRWGTGHPRTDFGVRFRRSDLGWAPLIWLSTALGVGVVVRLIDLLGVPYRSNLDAQLATHRDRTEILAFAVAAVLFAPIIEEIIFRGLMLRGLLSTMTPLPAIAVQASVFGVAHAQPAFGRENIGLVIALTTVGVGFGIACYLLRRIGPVIIAHAMFNAAAVVYLLVNSG